MSVFIGFQWFRLVFNGLRSVFFRVFQGSWLVFHGFRLFFHRSKWVLMVNYYSSRSVCMFFLFKVPGCFYMVTGPLLWFFKVPGWFFMVPGEFLGFFKVQGF